MGSRVFFHDFGKAAFGKLEVEISGVPGTEVEVALGEDAVAGRVNRTPGGFCCIKSGKITLSAPRGVYKFEIPRHRAPKYTVFSVTPPGDDEVAPFRYAEVSGECEVHGFVRRELFPAWDESASSFVSSDSDLNRIWEFCKYSMKAAEMTLCQSLKWFFMQLSCKIIRNIIPLDDFLGKAVGGAAHHKKVTMSSLAQASACRPPDRDHHANIKRWLLSESSVRAHTRASMRSGL